MLLRPAPLTFALLLAVELALIRLSTSRSPRIASAARLAVLIVPLVLALAVRAYLALSTTAVLDWDETYYVSLAVTASGGRGLYPYIFGYGEMPIMGGIGYAAYVYAVAVQVAGPTVLALRLVSLLASAAGLLCLWWLVRALYGSGPAWMAAALTSTLGLFAMSNTVRMDSLTLTWVLAALLVLAHAWRRQGSGRWHLFAGLMFGLGLQVHIDTVVTALACGLLYLLVWLRHVSSQRRLSLPVTMLLYASGWSLGLLVFVIFNILPDPEAFHRTTVAVRVDATGWYSSGTSSLLGSFLDPRILLAKELERYGLLFRALHGLEILLFLAAGLALVVRRDRVDRFVLIVCAGVLAGGAIVLNNASPLYFIHVTPALLVPLAPLFSHGLARQGKISTPGLAQGSLVAFAIVVSALSAVNTVRAVSRHPPAPSPEQLQYVRTARAAVPRDCRIAGDGSLYVRHFADYPYFISARPTEVGYGMLFYGLSSEVEYWERKSPDAVIMRGPLSPGLTEYVRSRGLSAVSAGVWLNPHGCTPPDA